MSSRRTPGTALSVASHAAGTFVPQALALTLKMGAGNMLAAGLAASEEGHRDLRPPEAGTSLKLKDRLSGDRTLPAFAPARLSRSSSNNVPCL